MHVFAVMGFMMGSGLTVLEDDDVRQLPCALREELNGCWRRGAPAVGFVVGGSVKLLNLGLQIG